MSQYRTIGIECDGDDQRCEEQVELTPGTTSPVVYWWDDFEKDESSDAIPDKFILGIYFGEAGSILHSDQVAVIVHRASDRNPIDGAKVDEKRANAQRIVNALNATTNPDWEIERAVAVLAASERFSVKDNETGAWK